MTQCKHLILPIVIIVSYIKLKIMSLYCKAKKLLIYVFTLKLDLIQPSHDYRARFLLHRVIIYNFCFKYAKWSWLLLQYADLSLKYIYSGNEVDFFALLTNDQKDLTWCWISTLFRIHSSHDKLKRWNTI